MVLQIPQKGGPFTFREPFWSLDSERVPSPGLVIAFIESPHWVIIYNSAIWSVYMVHLKGLVITDGLENQYSRQPIITESQDWKGRQMLLSPALFPALASGWDPKSTQCAQTQPSFI